MNGRPTIAGWMRKVKDSSTAFVAERALGGWIERYGHMLNLNIDSGRKTIECELLLKGETAPIVFQVKKYEVVTDASGTGIVIHEATASREWMAAILEDFVRGRRIPVPEKYTGILRMIV
jgi:hypothetical protein